MLLKNVKPNMDITNYGYIFPIEYLNVLEIDGDSDSRMTEFTEWRRLYSYDAGYTESMTELCGKTLVPVRENGIVFYECDCRSEGMNGPQWYSGFTRTGKTDSGYKDTGEYEYDADMPLGIDRSVPMEWDGKTCISLMSASIKILCTLDCIHTFDGVMDNVESYITRIHDELGLLGNISDSVRNAGSGAGIRMLVDNILHMFRSAEDSDKTNVPPDGADAALRGVGVEFEDSLPF